MRKSIHCMHVSLPTGIHTRLKAEAERSGQPMTVLAREAVEAWLVKREREALHRAIASYAQVVAGTPADLDPDMVSAAVDLLSWAGDERQVPELDGARARLDPATD